MVKEHCRALLRMLPMAVEQSTVESIRTCLNVKLLINLLLTLSSVLLILSLPYIIYGFADMSTDICGNCIVMY